MWNDLTIVNRIKQSNKRPLAFNSTNKELLDLIKKRSKLYSMAKYKINCENLSKTKVVKKFWIFMKKNKIQINSLSQRYSVIIGKNLI